MAARSVARSLVALAQVGSGRRSRLRLLQRIELDQETLALRTALFAFLQGRISAKENDRFACEALVPPRTEQFI